MIKRVITGLKTTALRGRSDGLTTRPFAERDTSPQI